MFRAGAACRQTGGQKQVYHAGRMAPQQRNGGIHYDTEYERKEDSLRLYCPSHHNTVTRLKWLTALTVDPEAKRRMLGLARKVETEVDESWYEAFYHHLRMEMDEYRRLKRSLRVLKSYTDYEEDLYEEAV